MLRTGRDDPYQKPELRSLGETSSGAWVIATEILDHLLQEKINIPSRRLIAARTTL
jgi:hypothetical protein